MAQTKYRVLVVNDKVQEMCQRLEDTYGIIQFTKTPYGTSATIVEFEYPDDPRDMAWIKKYDLTPQAECLG